jgi:hypothetical protein
MLEPIFHPWDIQKSQLARCGGSAASAIFVY